MADIICIVFSQVIKKKYDIAHIIKANLSKDMRRM